MQAMGFAKQSRYRHLRLLYKPDYRERTETMSLPEKERGAVFLHYPSLQTACLQSIPLRYRAPCGCRGLEHVDKP